MKTQINEISEYLKNNSDGITSLQAIKKFGVTRLSSVIYDLRHRYGMNISTDIVAVKTRYGTTNIAVYKLED